MKDLGGEMTPPSSYIEPRQEELQGFDTPTKNQRIVKQPQPTFLFEDTREEIQGDKRFTHEHDQIRENYNKNQPINGLMDNSDD